MKVIKWKAPSPQSTRMITTEEWRSVGVDQETVAWAPHNDWTVPADRVSKQAMRHLFLDTAFVVEGDDDDEPEVKDVPPVSEPPARGSRSTSNKRGGG